MKKINILFLICGFVILLTTNSAESSSSTSASDVAIDIFNSCISKLSVKCVKPKALSWISEVIQFDEIKINNDLSIIKNTNDDGNSFNNDNEQQQQQQRGVDQRIQLFDNIDRFLSTHSLRLQFPQILKTEEARSFLPTTLQFNNLEIPLAEGNIAEGRGFVKKVMIPFLLGLKFKTTVLVPIAFALIALKTWKALTLGLLSMVLSAAMVIFKFAKPKVVNYEVVHYPHHVEHHVDHVPHHIELPHHLDHHHVDHHHIDHHIDPHHHHHHVAAAPVEAYGWARQLNVDGQDLAYAGHL